MRTRATVGVVCGGPDGGGAVARAFAALPQASLRWICDETQQVAWAQSTTGTSRTLNLDDLLRDEQLDAIAFESTALTSGGRALAALEHDKHVFVAGPLAQTSAEADDLVEAAERHDRRVVAHNSALLRSGPRRLRRLIERGVLGEIYYLHARRYSHRVDKRPELLWTLTADAVALVLDLLGDQPLEVDARGETYIGGAGPDVIFASLRFATGITAHLHLSRLEGEEAEHLSVVGSELTAVLDIAEPSRELTLHANGPHVFDDFDVEQGGTITFWLPQNDPLRLGCAEFVASVRSPGHHQGAREAAATIAALEALTRAYAQCAPEGLVPRKRAVDENVIALPAR